MGMGIGPSDAACARVYGHVDKLTLWCRESGG